MCSEKREYLALHVPVYGDVLQELAGGAVLQDDALRGDLEGDLRSLLPASFGLLHKHNMQQLISFLFFLVFDSFDSKFSIKG